MKYWNECINAKLYLLKILFANYLKKSESIIYTYTKDSGGVGLLSMGILLTGERDRDLDRDLEFDL